MKCAPLKSVKLHSNYEEKYAVQEVDLTKSFTETFHLMTRYLLFVNTNSTVLMSLTFNVFVRGGEIVDSFLLGVWRKFVIEMSLQPDKRGGWVAIGRKFRVKIINS